MKDHGTYTHNPQVSSQMLVACQFSLIELTVPYERENQEAALLQGAKVQNLVASAQIMEMFVFTYAARQSAVEVGAKDLHSYFA